jgi:hypothetical protein
MCVGFPFGLLGAACQRAAAASFVPSLQVQLRAHQAREGTLVSRENTPWDATIVGWLRFRPTLAASDIPVRAEFDPEVAAIPCELEDLACLEEFSEGEGAASPLQGQLE